MNAQRRKKIETLKRRLTILIGEVSSLGDELAGIRDEEQEYLDNMPLSFQESEKGQKAQEAIENVVGMLEDFAGINADELDTAAA